MVQKVQILSLFAALGTSLVPFISTACPNVSVDKLFPCLCLQDSEELFCRGADGRLIDDQVLQKVMSEVISGLPSGQKTIKRFTLTQSDVTKIDEKLFKGLAFDEVTIRYNFRLRTVHKDAFVDSRASLKNVSFGEVASFYETKAMSPLALEFLQSLKLDNLFLSGLNVGSLGENLFRSMMDKGTEIFLNALYFQCDCKIKWIFEKLDPEKRKPFFGSIVEGAARDPNPLSCRHEAIGALIPLRALSLADFKNC